MQQKEDIKIEIEMFFRQIKDLCELMLENDNFTMPNILTLRNISESGIIKSKEL